ncbi:MAG: response regulator [Oligoflexales bacterium]
MFDKKDYYQVLVIEDDEALLESLSLGISLLTDDLDVATISSTDGKEGLKLCDDHHFDAIVTDYSMPNMDGMEFINEFRSKSKNKSVPILFASGFLSILD